jgi:hypothetical protein
MCPSFKDPFLSRRAKPWSHDSPLFVSLYVSRRPRNSSDQLQPVPGTKRTLRPCKLRIHVYAPVCELGSRAQFACELPPPHRASSTGQAPLMGPRAETLFVEGGETGLYST